MACLPRIDFASGTNSQKFSFKFLSTEFPSLPPPHPSRSPLRRIARCRVELKSDKTVFPTRSTTAYSTAKRWETSTERPTQIVGERVRSESRNSFSIPRSRSFRRTVPYIRVLARARTSVIYSGLVIHATFIIKATGPRIDASVSEELNNDRRPGNNGASVGADRRGRNSSVMRARPRCRRMHIVALR